MQTYTLLYNIKRDDREAIAFRSLSQQVADLRAALSRVATTATALAGTSPSPMALRLQQLERDVDRYHRQHTLSAQWPMLDRRVEALSRAIGSTLRVST